MTPFNIEEGRAEWSSFMPALMACLENTTGDVLEIGVGHYSTSALHDYCAGQKRTLVSAEEDEEWGMQFSHRYIAVDHLFNLGDYDDMIPLLVQMGPWSVVFLDHSPGPRRAADMMPFLDCAEFIVVHDYHLAIEEAFRPLVVGLACHVIQSKPPTAVFSKHRPIPASVLAL